MGEEFDREYRIVAEMSRTTIENAPKLFGFETEEEKEIYDKIAEVCFLRRMASDIDAEIACLEGLDDWQADELARQATIRKRAVEKRIRDMTEGQP